MEQCESVGTTGEPMPGAIRDAVAAAVEGGATMDGIVARVRAWSGESTGSDEDRAATRMGGLIGLQRGAVRIAEEWQRTREPGTEGRAALVAIEILRTQTLGTMAALSARDEPLSTLELGRIALTLNRIERADTLRIARERAAAEGADAGTQEEWEARPDRMTHEVKIERSRGSLEGSAMDWPATPVEEAAPASGWAENAAQDPGTAPPAPAPDAPFDDSGVQDAWGARGAHDATDQEDASPTESVSDASEAPDTRDARGTRDDRGSGVPQDIAAVLDAPDDREYSVARDVEMRQRDRGRQLWPTDLHVCPALWHTFC